MTSVMDRRLFIAIVGGCILLPTSGVKGQAPSKTHRVGYLSIGSASDSRRVAIADAFRQGLHNLGYIENRNITIETRFAEEGYDQLPGLAAELIRLRVDTIVAYSTPAVKATLGVTKTFPIVMTGVVDPVATGFVASLGRPGGNVTGMSLMAPEIIGKQMQLLKELVPKVSRIAVLWNPANPSGAPQLREGEVAARTLRMQLQPLEARNAHDLGAAFAAAAHQRVDAMVCIVDGFFIDNRIHIAHLAEKARLPTAYGLREHADAGGLMFYGASPVEQSHRAAGFVDKIFKGAKPGDLPVEQPTTFELVINLRTAKALGLTIPPSLLARADEMIQ
jgi:putative ABC transport system substrate-binding protein